MAYPTRTPSVAIGGTRTWQARTLREAMAYVGFNPNAEGSEYMLDVHDIHFFNESYVPQITTLSAGISAELLVLASMPPKCIVLNGDVLTEYSGDRGSNTYTAIGALEAGYSNSQMTKFTALAPIKVVTGNHDTGVYEYRDHGRLDYFLSENCTWYGDNTSVQTWDCGGVLCASIGCGHDASLPVALRSGIKSDLLAAVATPAREVALFYHHPGFARVIENQVMQWMLDIIPPAMTNQVWGFCGHNHTFADIVWQLPSTTLFQRTSGCTAPTRITSGDGTHETMMAVAMSGGKVRGWFHFDGRTGIWTVMNEDLRSSTPIAMPLRDAGISGTVLAEWWESEYVRGDPVMPTFVTPLNQASPFTARDVMSWIRYVQNLTVKFPCQAGANRFWMSMNRLPTTVEMSNDGSSWVAASPPALLPNVIAPNPAGNITNIPAPGGVSYTSGDLYVKITTPVSPEVCISGWGFSQV